MKKWIALSSAMIALAFLMAFKQFTTHKQLDDGQQFADTLLYPEETHFKNIRQLTFGGDNAEAYWSYDSKHLSFQRTNPKEGVACDQIFVGTLPTTANSNFEMQRVSNGKGRTTCAFFYPNGQDVVYASTHLKHDTCPAVPDRKQYGNRYIWPIYPEFDIFKSSIDGKKVTQLTKTPGYDAEATFSADGKKMIFTSMRDGDLDLYTADVNGKNVKRVTKLLGYDGGAWFSPDGKLIVWRASRPKTDAEIKDYKELLAQNLVAPTNMEVWVANADGSNAKQITNYGQANWAPNFTPDGKHVIFCSNHEYKRGFPFNMYIIDLDGKNLQKISRDKGFDAFPMFSPDGKKIAFCSNRNNGGTRDTNIFVADWVE
jgi:TolB protein